MPIVRVIEQMFQLPPMPETEEEKTSKQKTPQSGRSLLIADQKLSQQKGICCQQKDQPDSARRLTTPHGFQRHT